MEPLSPKLSSMPHHHHQSPFLDRSRQITELDLIPKLNPSKMAYSNEQLYESLFNKNTLHKKPLRVEKSARGTRIAAFDEPAVLSTKPMELTSRRSAKERSDGGGNGGEVKVLATSNERRRAVQNNFESNVLGLMRKSLDGQANKVQLQLKREESMIFDQFINDKVINYNYVRRRKLLELRSQNEASSRAVDPSSGRIVQTGQQLHQQQMEFLLPGENYGKSRHALPPHNSPEVDMGVLFSKDEEEMIKKAFSLNSNLINRFVEQKRTCGMPQYLQQRVKSSGAPQTDDEFLKITERARKRNEKYRNACSKSRDHRVAEQKAESYNSFKQYNRGMHLLNSHQLSSKTTNSAFHSRSMPNMFVSDLIDQPVKDSVSDVGTGVNSGGGVESAFKEYVETVLPQIPVINTKVHFNDPMKRATTSQPFRKLLKSKSTLDLTSLPLL